MAPAMVRRKLITPAAEAVSSGSTADSAIVVSGMKKKGIPMPCSNCGSASVQKSAPVVQCARNAEVNPSHRIPNVTSMRGSTLVTSLPTMGDMSTAHTPMKAVT